MTWLFGITALGVLVGVAVMFNEFFSHRTAARVGREAVSAWLATPPEERAEAMRAQLALLPNNPVAWYLRGCSQTRAGRIKDAARSFGMAYHLDVDIETAALLTFACLKSRDGEGSDILDQIAETWDEMGRPALQESAADRQLLSTLSEGDAPAALSALGRLVWAVTSESQRAQISAGRLGTSRLSTSFFN